jgi:hypothetical protein
MELPRNPSQRARPKLLPQRHQRLAARPRPSRMDLGTRRPRPRRARQRTGRPTSFPRQRRIELHHRPDPYRRRRLVVPLTCPSWSSPTNASVPPRLHRMPAAMTSRRLRPSHGFITIAVLRSPSAPHAALVDEKLRYPKRNGRPPDICQSPRWPLHTRSVQRERRAKRTASSRLSRMRSTGSIESATLGWS